MNPKRERSQDDEPASDIFPFDELPKDVQDLIAKTSPSTLISMARLNRMFAALVKNDYVWRLFFERDFPQEWLFCRGQLPYFVLRSRPDILEQDASPWKRFYLHTELDYRMFAKFFADMYGVRLKLDDFAPIDFKTASMQTIRQWVQRVPLGKHFKVFSYKSALAWKAVSLLATVFAAPDYNFDRVDSETLPFAQYALARHSGRDWLIRYLFCCNPGDLNTGDYETDHNYGPHEWEVSVELSRDPNLRARWEAWKEGRLVSTEVDRLFSEGDRNRLAQEPGVGEHVLLCWDLLSASYHIPCLFSLPTLTNLRGEVWRGMRSKVQMIRNSAQVEEETAGLILPDDVDAIILACKPFSKVARRLLGDSYFVESDYNDIDQLFAKYLKAPRNSENVIIHIDAACIQCGSEAGTLQQCGGTCESAIYCSVDCQAKHWVAGHHKECQKKKQ
jgi:hypothetical protein